MIPGELELAYCLCENGQAGRGWIQALIWKEFILFKGGKTCPHDHFKPTKTIMKHVTKLYIDIHLGAKVIRVSQASILLEIKSDNLVQ